MFSRFSRFSVRFSGLGYTSSRGFGPAYLVMKWAQANEVQLLGLAVCLVRSQKRIGAICAATWPKRTSGL